MAEPNDPRAELERLRKMKRLRELEAKASGQAAAPATPAQPVSPFLQRGMDMVSNAQATPRTGKDANLDRKNENIRVTQQVQRAAREQQNAERRAMVDPVDDAARAAGDRASDKAREGSMANPGAYALSGFAGFNAGRQAEEEVYQDAGVMAPDTALALRGSNALAGGLPGILSEEYRNLLAQAGEDRPGESMGGDLVGFGLAGLGAWNTTRAGINAFARPFIPQGSSAAARGTRYVAPRVGEVTGAAAQNAVFQAGVQEPIRAAGAGEDLTLEGMGRAAQAGATDPLNLLPLGASAINRTWDLVTSGIAAPSRVAADMMNRFGVAPRQTAASQGIADASQSLAGQVQPEDIRGLTNIENALQFALRDNANFPDAASRNARIAAGFERIREALPGNDDTTLNLARLIEREFAEDAPQTRDIIRSFLQGVGGNSPGGAQIVGTAANNMRGQQADILEQEAYSVFGGQPKMEAKTVLDQNLEMLGEETYTPILRQARTAPPEAQQRAAALIARRPEAEDILFNRADREGLTVQQYIDRNPLEALHWVQSELGARARAQSAAQGFSDLDGIVQNMKTVLRDNVTNYREADALYASNAQAYDRLGTTRGAEFGTQGELKYDPGFGERLLGGGGSAPAGTRAEGRATAQTVYEGMDDQSRRAAAISVRDVILDDLDKARTAGIDQRYETAAKFQRLQTEGALQALVDVFGEEGQRIVNRIRQFVDANDFARAIDPEVGSNTANKLRSGQTGAQPFAGPMGQATQSAAGSMGQNAVGDAFMMASGITSAPVLSAIKFVPWIANRLQPGQRTQRNIANTLLRGVERGADAAPLPPAPPPIAPLTPEQLPGRQNAFSQTMSNGQTQPAPTGNAFTRSQGLPQLQNDALAGGLYGGVGAFSGNFVDYNQDGETNLEDMLIGAGVGAVGGAGASRVGSKVNLPKGKGTRWDAEDVEGFADRVIADAKPKPITRVATEDDLDDAITEAVDMFRQFQTSKGKRFDFQDAPSPRTAGPDDQPMMLVEEMAAQILRSRGIDPDPVLAPRIGERFTNAESERFNKALRFTAGQAKAAERQADALAAQDPMDTAIDQLDSLRLNNTKPNAPGLGNAFAEGAFGSVGGSALGSRQDLNGDGVIDEQDVMIGAGGGLVGAPAITAAMRRGGNAFAGDAATMGAGGRKPPPDSPEAIKAAVKGLAKGEKKPTRLEQMVDEGRDAAVPPADPVRDESQKIVAQATRMMERGDGVFKIHDKTGVVMVPYNGSNVPVLAPDTNPETAIRQFYEALQLPADQRPEWVQGVIERANPKPGMLLTQRQVASPDMLPPPAEAMPPMPRDGLPIGAMLAGGALGIPTGIAGGAAGYLGYEALQAELQKRRQQNAFAGAGQ